MAIMHPGRALETRSHHGHARVSRGQSGAQGRPGARSFPGSRPFTSSSFFSVLLLAVGLGACLAAPTPSPPTGTFVCREIRAGDPRAQACGRGPAPAPFMCPEVAEACGTPSNGANQPLLVLRGGGSKLAQQVKKKAKRVATESAPLSEPDAGSFWTGEQGSRRADTKSFQAHKFSWKSVHSGFVG
jgi:hypothetical protein